MIHLTLHKKWQVHWAKWHCTHANVFYADTQQYISQFHGRKHDYNWNTYSAKVQERKEQNSITMIKPNFGSLAQSLLKSTEDLLVWWYILIGNDGSTWMTNWLICIKYLLSLLLKCPQLKWCEGMCPLLITLTSGNTLLHLAAPLLYVISIIWLCLLQSRCNNYIIMIIIKLQKTTSPASWAPLKQWVLDSLTSAVSLLIIKQAIRKLLPLAAGM